MGVLIKAMEKGIDKCEQIKKILRWQNLEMILMWRRVKNDYQGSCLGNGEESHDSH